MDIKNELKTFYKPGTNKVNGYIFNLILFSRIKNFFSHVVNVPEE
jgi:hypothetical protein